MRCALIIRLQTTEDSSDTAGKAERIISANIPIAPSVVSFLQCFIAGASSIHGGHSRGHLATCLGISKIWTTDNHKLLKEPQDRFAALESGNIKSKSAVET